MEVEPQVASMDVEPELAPDDESPKTPSPAKGTRGTDGATDVPMPAVGAEGAPDAAKAGAAEAEATTEVETPPKSSQAPDHRGEDGKDGSEEEDDSNQALGVDLYYVMLRLLFKELGLYANPPEAGLLDPKKQLLVYHHAARLFELRTDVVGALQGDLSVTASLPVAFQKVARHLRKKLKESEQLERLGQLTEKELFGHDHAIRFVESNLPTGAKECCVFLREKPHAFSDRVQNISPFRDVIKFHCFKNPIIVMEEHGMGLALTIEKTIPPAYLVVSPFLKKPELMVDACSLGWQQLEDMVADNLMEFIANDVNGWRHFVQRRANIVSKGSLAIIQRVLRMKPNTEGLDESATQALKDLQEEVEVLREKAKKAEEIAKKRAEMKHDKENMSLEKQLLKAEEETIELQVLTERMQEDVTRTTRQLDEKEKEGTILEERASIAEKAVSDQREEFDNQRKELENFRRKYFEELGSLRDKHVAATAALCNAEDKLRDTEKQLAVKRAEAELLAGGVQEMLVETKKFQVAKHAMERAKDKFRMEAKDAIEKASSEAKEAMEKASADVTQAQERLAEAQQKEVEARATLLVKMDAVEQVTASNVSLRAEASAAREEVAQAKEQLAAVKVAEGEARSEVARVSEEMQTQKSEVQRLGKTVEEQSAALTTAKAESEKSTALMQEAERRAVEASQAQAETAARLQIKTDEALDLTESCSKFSADVTRLSNALNQECDKAAAAERLAADRGAQLEVKSQSLEASRVSEKAAKDEVAKHFDIVIEAEKVAGEARMEASRLGQELQAKKEEAQRDCSKFAEEVSRLSTALERECNRSVAAEQLAAERAGQLEVKSASMEALMETNSTLRASEARANAKADAAGPSVLAAEKAANDAREKEAKAHAELAVKMLKMKEMEGTIASLQAEPEKLRVEMAKVRAEAKQCQIQTDEAEERAKEYRDGESRAAARLLVKEQEAAGLASECAVLRAEVERIIKQAEAAEERATAAQLAEVAAKASLQLKIADAERVSSTNVELRTEIIKAKSEVEAANGRAVAAESTVAAAYRARDQAQAELRGKAAAAESMSAAMASLRADVTASRRAESEAAEAAKKAVVEAEAAAETVLAAKRAEQRAVINLKVKADEATRVTNECSTLRAGNDLLREKGESSAAIVRALATACEKLKAELEAVKASNARWSALEETLAATHKQSSPDHAAPQENVDVTFEDLESALSQPFGSAADVCLDDLEEALEPKAKPNSMSKDSKAPSPSPTVEAVARHLPEGFLKRRRIRSKGPAPPALATPVTPSPAALAAPAADAAAGVTRRLRAKTAEPESQKRARLEAKMGDKERPFSAAPSAYAALEAARKQLVAAEEVILDAD